MLVHVVLMRLQPGVSGTKLRDLVDRVRALAATVAGPDSCVVGPNISEEPLSQEFEFGFVVSFAGQAQLDAYHVNPAHLAIGLAIRNMTTTVLVFDLAS